MLDEVDAPLDDANVGRYARLVKEMSQTVQFIYITHNKIAMEMADQLMGVTMHEPVVRVWWRWMSRRRWRWWNPEPRQARTFQRDVRRFTASAKLANGHIVQGILTDGVKLSLVVLV
jgi:energy-coupling factor transporter ATP-binding protein EcfA2